MSTKFSFSFNFKWKYIFQHKIFACNWINHHISIIRKSFLFTLKFNHLRWSVYVCFIAVDFTKIHWYNIRTRFNSRLSNRDIVSLTSTDRERKWVMVSSNFTFWTNCFINVLTLYIILELPLFDCIIIINSVVAVALYEETIYIGLSCYPILFSTFLNKISLN